MKNASILVISFFFILHLSCQSRDPNYGEPLVSGHCSELNFDYQHQKGCDGKEYPDPKTSKYVLPYPRGISYSTGLTNCSSSYHGANHPDRYAFDFNIPIDTPFYAARGGTVVYVVNNQSSQGGGSGNWCVIHHLDNTYGIYLHSPENGIAVKVGDAVKQGDYLGLSGKSGLAGYPHLHFIVVQNDYKWPYDAIPITFKNAFPADVILKSNTDYKACDY